MAGELPQEDVEPVTAQSVEMATQLEDNYAERLEASRAAIMSYIAELRPRFVATFESMTFERGGICVAVPTTELQEEILRAQTELLTRVVEIAGIRGKIELNIEVNEAIRAARPIRLEDKIAHINKLNPHIEELRKVLDLIVE